MLKNCFVGQIRPVEFLAVEEHGCGGVTVIGGAKAATFFAAFGLSSISSIWLAGAKSTSKYIVIKSNILIPIK